MVKVYRLTHFDPEGDDRRGTTTICDDDELHARPDALRAKADALNEEARERKRQQHAAYVTQYGTAKAEHEALVAAGLRTEPYQGWEPSAEPDLERYIDRWAVEEVEVIP